MHRVDVRHLVVQSLKHVSPVLLIQMIRVVNIGRLSIFDTVFKYGSVRLNMSFNHSVLALIYNLIRFNGLLDMLMVSG